MLRVITSMNPEQGGPCQGIRNSVPQLQTLGVQTDVVCMDDPNSRYLKSEKFTIHAVGTSKGPWAYNPALYTWLLEHVSEYDVVIVHGLWQYHGFCVNKVFKNLKSQKASSIPKLCIMPHGMLDPYFQKAPERKLKAIRNFIYWKLIESSVINHADALLFTCEEELLLAKQSFSPYKPQRELNVSYGVKMPPEYSVSMKNAFLSVCSQVSQKPFLLFLSRIHQKKGVDMLLHAYESVYTKFINSNAQVPMLVIAGPGMDSEYGKSLLSIVNTSKFLQDNVVFTGMLQGDAKWGALYACNAFILPSHQENFGIAVVEAMACSKAVLISDKVNIFREIVGDNAGLVAENTFEGTHDLLNKWNTLNESEQTNMGNNAKQSYLAHFTIESASKQFLERIKTIN